MRLLDVVRLPRPGREARSRLQLTVDPAIVSLGVHPVWEQGDICLSRIRDPDPWKELLSFSACQQHRGRASLFRTSV